MSLKEIASILKVLFLKSISQFVKHKRNQTLKIIMNYLTTIDVTCNFALIQNLKSHLRYHQYKCQCILSTTVIDSGCVQLSLAQRPKEGWENNYPLSRKKNMSQLRVLYGSEQASHQPSTHQSNFSQNRTGILRCSKQSVAQDV